MRQLTKDPNAAAKARAAEQKANEEAGLKSIDLASLSASTSASVKKKPVFKSTLQPENAVAEPKPTATTNNDDDDPTVLGSKAWWKLPYDPRYVTGCDEPGCKCCVNGVRDMGPIDYEEIEEIIRKWDMGIFQPLRMK